MDQVQPPEAEQLRPHVKYESSHLPSGELLENELDSMYSYILYLSR